MIVLAALALGLSVPSWAQLRNPPPAEQDEIMKHVRAGLAARAEYQDQIEKEKFRRPYALEKEIPFSEDPKTSGNKLLDSWDDAYEKTRSARKEMEREFAQAIHLTMKAYNILPDDQNHPREVANGPFARKLRSFIPVFSEPVYSDIEFYVVNDANQELRYFKGDPRDEYGSI